MKVAAHGGLVGRPPAHQSRAQACRRRIRLGRRFSDQTLGSRRSTRYIMLGTTCLFGAFTFIFVQNEHGVVRAHYYHPRHVVGLTWFITHKAAFRGCTA